MTADLADRITEEVSEAHEGGGPGGRGPGGPVGGSDDAGESATPSVATTSDVEPAA